MNAYVTFTYNGFTQHGWIEGVSDDGDLFAIKLAYPPFTTKIVKSSAIINVQSWSSNIFKHGRNEINAAYDLPDLQNSMIHILDVITQIGHENEAVYACLGDLAKLGRFEPLTPLTGEDDEWIDHTDSNSGKPLYQNKRCGRIFKTSESNDTSYDIEGITWLDRVGPYYNKDSQVPIEFPYTPKTRYVIGKK